MYTHTHTHTHTYVYIYICIITVIINVGMEVCNLFICKVFFHLSKIYGLCFLTLLVIKFVKFFSKYVTN